MSPIPPITHERLARIGGGLPDWSHEAEPDPPEGYREAAVALVLRASEAVDLLLIKRSKSERDPWSGHMALPGGRRDPGDATLLHTAMRETREETAVDLPHRSVLGTLELVAPTSERLPRLSVVPFVFGLEGPIEAVVNSYEVASVHWVPLATLKDPASRSTTTILLPDGPREFPCFRVDGQIVWGLTHRILERFLQVV